MKHLACSSGLSNAHVRSSSAPKQSGMSDDKDKESGKNGVNVKVILRCRPLSELEKKDPSQFMVVSTKVDAKEVFVSQTVPGRKVESYNKTFTFDGVCNQYTSQHELFNTYIVPIVEEVLLGFNCTIFAYGQTGTGKTYTMEGDIYSRVPWQQRHDAHGPAVCRLSSLSQSSITGGGVVSSNYLTEQAGIISRSVQHIFERLEEQNTEYSVRVSYLEIYNEELNDLLNDGEKLNLRIYEDSGTKKGLSVDRLEEIPVNNPQDIFNILSIAVKKRRTAETILNRQSSRSHCIFSVTIHMKEINLEGEDVIKIGKLNLVDLAGSENIQRSGAHTIKDRAKEAGMINQSLLTLGRVINALVEHSSYIPYRDSKLTRLLQESLGGRTKTCVVATISPSSLCLEETLSTLDYAFRAKNIRNRPEVNQKMTKRVMIRELNHEIEKLKLELQANREKSGVYLPFDRYSELEARLTCQDSELIDAKAEIGKLQAQVEKITAEEVILQNHLITEQLAKAAILENLEKKESELKTVKEELEQSRQHLLKEEIVATALRDAEQQLHNKCTQLVNALEHTGNDLNHLHNMLKTNRENGESLKEAIQLFIGNTLTTMHIKMDSIIKIWDNNLQEYIQLMNNKLNESYDHTYKDDLNIKEENKRIDIITTQISDSFNKNVHFISKLLDDTIQQIIQCAFKHNDIADQLFKDMIRKIEPDILYISSELSLTASNVTTFTSSLTMLCNNYYDDIKENLSQLSKDVTSTGILFGSNACNVRLTTEAMQKKLKDIYEEQHSTLEKDMQLLTQHFQEATKTLVETQKTKTYRELETVFQACQSIKKNVTQLESCAKETIQTDIVEKISNTVAKVSTHQLDIVRELETLQCTTHEAERTAQLKLTDINQSIHCLFKHAKEELDNSLENKFTKEVHTAAQQVHTNLSNLSVIHNEATDKLQTNKTIVQESVANCLTNTLKTYKQLQSDILQVANDSEIQQRAAMLELSDLNKNTKMCSEQSLTYSFLSTGDSPKRFTVPSSLRSVPSLLVFTDPRVEEWDLKRVTRGVRSPLVPDIDQDRNQTNFSNTEQSTLIDVLFSDRQSTKDSVESDIPSLTRVASSTCSGAINENLSPRSVSSFVADPINETSSGTVNRFIARSVSRPGSVKSRRSSSLTRSVVNMGKRRDRKSPILPINNSLRNLAASNQQDTGISNSVITSHGGANNARLPSSRFTPPVSARTPLTGEGYSKISRSDNVQLSPMPPSTCRPEITRIPSNVTTTEGILSDFEERTNSNIDSRIKFKSSISNIRIPNSTSIPPIVTDNSSGATSATKETILQPSNQHIFTEYASFESKLTNSSQTESPLYSARSKEKENIIEENSYPTLSALSPFPPPLKDQDVLGPAYEPSKIPQNGKTMHGRVTK